LLASGIRRRGKSRPLRMNRIDLPKISSLIFQKLGKEVELLSAEKIGSGYHSDGFKLTAKNGQTYFLKRVKSHDLGFELPERKVMSLLLSNGMSRRSALQPQPIGVILSNKNETGIIPEINEETEIYQLQEFQPEGISYWSILQNNKQKKHVDAKDLSELEKITDYICHIHQVKHPAKDVEQLKSVYNDGLRSVLISPELTIMLLHDFTEEHPLLPISQHGAYVGLMLNLIHEWKNRYERLSALHGDFWGANLFFKANGEVWVIDYSRIPWGDPGVDIGWWLSQYLWSYHETKNEYFKELGEKFLEIYIKKSGDQEIRQAVSLTLGLLGIIYISPRFYPELNLVAAKSFFDNIKEILKSKQFVWLK
jgi:thiamine kinase-like enzyme